VLLNENMTRPQLSVSSLSQLLTDSIPQREKIEGIYSLIPPAQCLRRTRCCSFLPEMAWIEALSILDQIIRREASWRKGLVEEIIRYFFINPVEIVGCPFLEGRDCSIYTDRAFGCRAYGLWSPKYYQDLVDKNIQGKKVVQQAWDKLGVILPESVLQFRPPYCRQTKSAAGPSDETLESAYQNIVSLSQDISGHRFFAEECFNDFSFFMAQWVYGPREAVRLKYLIVRDNVKECDRERLESVLRMIPDIA
jgi:Fe-S-cluster containining protein